MNPGRSRQRGVISLETALLFPAVLAVLLAFFDITRVHLQYSLLEHAMRSSLRVLLAEDWRKKPLNSTVVKRMIDDKSYGFIDNVSVDIILFESLEELLNVKQQEEDKSTVFRPRDPVFRVTATLSTKMEFSPLATLYPEPLVFTSTLIASKDLPFD
ncbi:pilus assembly protein [Vibrio sp. J1-1]|uniref:TadE/TadG family type IV pilus assembly protein n=1 Tax=Vibrio sp. J1-1 TaxID=2912251 RepID=UPI001D5F843C|nr:TadE/TadG family type IV pilus assembly protein [Vibrio sp. J1-1]MBR9788018.1 pilus assembly protein [Vibrionaceae bacterium]MBR9875538.1 pilus assembly protein [Vibrionaceae bacterium]MCF7482199.1 pilus assembly protein [Vibrio sp. J1-1]